MRGPLRTLSSRILLGFAALTITFAVITATVVRNMGDVEDEIVLIGKGFVPLALVSKDLARKQEDLRTYIEERIGDESNPSIARRTLARLTAARNRAVNETTTILDRLDTQIEVDPRQFRFTRPKLESLQKDVADTAPLYEQVSAAPPLGDPAAFDDKHKVAAAALAQLKAQERAIWTKTNRLSEDLEARVEHITPELEAAGHTVRLRTIYLGGVAVLLGLLVTIWVVITLRPLARLGAAARRIAAGDYASRIDEKGPAEVASLAREFNSMGRAVEERERELVRSERLAAVGKMAAMITHEVRNPLSSIGLNTELLEEELVGSANEDEARALCRAITREVDRLTAITEEYLAFARLPKPKIAAEPVNPMLTALAAFVRPDLAQRQVALACELGDPDPVALADASQLRQCLVNLVRNAAEAVAAKGGGTVVLRSRQDGARVVIEVEDDGIGIPPDVLPKLFDPFFSTKEGGSGLGLALTNQIVKDHGGELSVTSAIGRGTTFTVRLPITGGATVAIAE